MIRRFASYYLPHKRLFIIDFFSAVVVAVLELAFPLAVQWFIDTLLPGDDWSAIVSVSAGLFLIYIISTFLQFIVGYWGHKLGINIETDMREELFEHVQKQSFRFFDIAYGMLNASDKQIMEAARKAHLETFIEGLPKGYETQIGERGLKLSGGQKQRIAIARMFLKNPPILILDEATSALDTETERIIQQALTELAENRTTLIIADRLATIRNADKIVVVTEEGIVEEGSHDDLLKQGGIFSNLHQLQYQK